MSQAWASTIAIALVKKLLNKSGRLGLGEKKFLPTGRERARWEKTETLTLQQSLSDLREEVTPHLANDYCSTLVLGPPPWIHVWVLRRDNIVRISCKMLFQQKALILWERSILFWNSANHTGQNEREVSLPQRTVVYLFHHQCFELSERLCLEEQQ